MLKTAQQSAHLESAMNTACKMGKLKNILLATALTFGLTASASAFNPINYLRSLHSYIGLKAKGYSTFGENNPYLANAVFGGFIGAEKPGAIGGEFGIYRLSPYSDENINERESGLTIESSIQNTALQMQWLLTYPKLFDLLSFREEGNPRRLGNTMARLSTGLEATLEKSEIGIIFHEPNGEIKEIRDTKKNTLLGWVIQGKVLFLPDTGLPIGLGIEYVRYLNSTTGIKSAGAASIETTFHWGSLN